MSAIRVGDSWVFDRGDILMPVAAGTGEWFDFTPAEPPGASLPTETYHFTLTGTLIWDRPAAGEPINLQVEIDIDGFDSTTGEQLPGGDMPGGFDSGVYPRFSHTAPASEGVATVTTPFIAQAVAAVPVNCRLMLRLHSLVPGYNAILKEARLVASVVNAK